MTAPEIEDHLAEALHPRLFDPGETTHVLSLAERFLLPPFTQLDARSGMWQERKRMWLDLGLRSDKGRMARTFAKSAGKDDVSKKILALTNGQSIFDPVLCELAYRWFCPPAGYILDPFAGGSVRGVVAAVTGRQYVGVDLSPLQVAANRLQDEDFVDRHVYAAGCRPEWVVGDSARMADVLAAYDDENGTVWNSTGYDFVWSCPPYHDLEKYSDDPADLSNMTWDAFASVYRDIIVATLDRLNDDRFAAFVVGEIRGKDGFYRHFVQATIDAFELGGAAYYNEALLVSPAGTLPLRAAGQFVATRKMGRTHQTVLVFCKGDPKKATQACADRAAEEAAVRAMGRDLADLDVDDEDYTPGWGHG